MHQCLRCNQSHTGTSLFCGYCQQTLLNRYHPKQQPGNRFSSFVFEEVSCIREPKLLRLPIRSQYTPQERQFENEQEKKQKPLPTSLEIRPPQSLYKTIVQNRLRIAFIVLVVLALLALVIDSVLALEVITHKPHSTHKISTSNASSSVPPIIPIQVTPQHTSINTQPAATRNIHLSDNRKKSTRSVSTGLADQVSSQNVTGTLKSQQTEICNCSKIAFDHQEWKGL